MEIANFVLEYQRIDGFYTSLDDVRSFARGLLLTTKQNEVYAYEFARPIPVVPDDATPDEIRDAHRQTLYEYGRIDTGRRYIITRSPIAKYKIDEPPEERWEDNQMWKDKDYLEALKKYLPLRPLRGTRQRAQFGNAFLELEWDDRTGTWDVEIHDGSIVVGAATGDRLATAVECAMLSCRREARPRFYEWLRGILPPPFP